jgi:hypothetical protein
VSFNTILTPLAICVVLALLSTAAFVRPPAKVQSRGFAAFHPGPLSAQRGCHPRGSERHTQSPIAKSPIRNQGYCSSEKNHTQNNIPPPATRRPDVGKAEPTRHKLHKLYLSIASLSPPSGSLAQQRGATRPPSSLQGTCSRHCDTYPARGAVRGERSDDTCICDAPHTCRGTGARVLTHSVSMPGGAVQVSSPPLLAHEVIAPQNPS